MKTLTFLMAASLLLAACGTSASSTATSSATASPVVSPVPSLGPTPTDFVLPQGCSYVGKGVADLAISTLMTWEVDCGAAPDFQAVEKFTPAFAQQGWTVCFRVGGRGVWAKGTTQTLVSQSAVGYPTLSQLPRQTQDCPLANYVNGQYRFSLVLPDPYRKSVGLSMVNAGQQRPAAEDVFTARTDADEAAIGTYGCHTACPTWNYAAYVTVNTGTGAETLRQYYASAEGATTSQVIEDTTVDGRPAIRITNGARYPMQFIVKDGDRIVVLAYQLYPLSNGISVPAGATKEKLDGILASFRFTP